MKSTGVSNVLLITVDSLRFDYPFGEDWLDFGTNTLHFERAFATGPGTTPSFPALLTGTLPLSYGGLGPLSDERPRLAKELRSAGVHTAGFQCNPFLSEHFNYDTGFDVFEDYQNPLMGIATRIFPRGIEIRNPTIRRIDNVLSVTDLLKKSYQLVKGKPRPYVSAEVITNDTIKWLDGAREPFFCWTHYMDAHHPCFPPESYRREYGVGDVMQSEVARWYSALLREPETLSAAEIGKLKVLYEASIEYLSRNIQSIFVSLKENGLLENTCVIITSDHGELFGDYGKYGKPERMYDELVRVPLVVVNGPDYLRNATEDLVSLLDVPPIIHDVLSVKIPEKYQGRLPGLDPPRELILAEHEVDGKVVVGARSEEWLYESDEICDERRLYSLRAEGVEQVPLKQQDAAGVIRAVNNRLTDLDVDAQFLNEEIDNHIHDRLEDLGYL